MIKAVLFDIDGTLVDSNEQHVTAWLEALAQVGASPDRQAVHRQMGKGADMLVPALLPDADEARIEALGEAHGAIFKKRFLEGIAPFPQAGALLARVHDAAQRVVLASSASRGEVDHYLGLLGAGELVAATTCSDDVENTKPAPDIFAAALGRLKGIGPDEAMVVGDTPYDIEAARRCGIAAIALRSGGFEDALLADAGAVEIHDDAAALLAAYDRSALAR